MAEIQAQHTVPLDDGTPVHLRNRRCVGSARPGPGWVRITADLVT